MLNIKTERKDIFFLLLYLLIMFLLFTYGAYIILFPLKIIFMPWFEGATGILGKLGLIIGTILLFIGIPVVLVLYFIAPFLVTRMFINKKLSKYVNGFFNNIWLMTAALVVIHACVMILYRIKFTGDLNNLLFLFREKYNIYIAPQCIFLYVVFVLKKIYIKYYRD